MQLFPRQERENPISLPSKSQRRWYAGSLRSEDNAGPFIQLYTEGSATKLKPLTVVIDEHRSTHSTAVFCWVVLNPGIREYQFTQTICPNTFANQVQMALAHSNDTGHMPSTIHPYLQHSLSPYALEWKPFWMYLPSVSMTMVYWFIHSASAVFCCLEKLSFNINSLTHLASWICLRNFCTGRR